MRYSRFNLYFKKLAFFTYTTTSTLYSFFNRFDNFSLFSWIEVCCLWRGNSNAFINIIKTNGLEIILYRHSDGSHLCLQARSICRNQTVKWMNKFFWMKEIELYYYYYYFKALDSNECLIQIIPFQCNFSDWNITGINREKNFLSC